MKKLLGLVVLLALSTLPAMAQSEGYPKFEVGGGFMFRNFDVPFSPRANEIGWFTTADYNFANWLGFALDVDEGFTNTSVTLPQMHHFTFLAGPRIYPIGHHKITPFAQALFGDSTIIFVNEKSFDSGQTLSDDKLAVAVGGGVDWALTHRIAIRLAEVDFERDKNFAGGTPGNPAQNNFKYKGGVIIRF